MDRTRAGVVPILAVLLLLAAPAAAETAGTARDGVGAGRAPAGTEYLAGPQPGEVRASRLIGAPVHAAPDPLIDQVVGMAGNSPAGLLARALPRQRIGQVTDLVLGPEGEVRAVLVEVGRFTGDRGKVVAVPIGAIGREGPPDAPVLLLAATRDELRRAPHYGAPASGARSLAMTPASGMAGAGGNGAGLVASGGIARDGAARLPLAAAGTRGATMAGQDYRHVAMGELTGAVLRGAEVHDSDGDRVGTTRSVEETDSGIITAIVVEMGGMLGIGGHTVAVPVGQISVLRQTGAESGMRIRTTLTRAQMQTLPRHRP